MMWTLDPFDDARLRIQRAHKHITDFESLLRSFFADDKPWTTLIEPKPDGTGYVHKLKFSKDIPGEINVLAAEAFASLRSALDLATSACARLNGAPRIKNIYFPFGKNSVAWEETAKNRCRFVPEPVLDYFRSLKLYPGGDERLCALASVRNANEHWAITPTTVSAMAAAINRPGRRQEFVAIPEGIFEIELFTTIEHTKDYYVEIINEVRFEGVEAFKHIMPDTVLRELAERVANILEEMQTILRRLSLGKREGMETPTQVQNRSNNCEGESNRMPDAAPYYVAVDTNIWVEERLLQSSIGSAFLYAVTGAKSSILLPEVVELEIARVLPDLAEQAVGRIKRDLSLLRQLSGQDVTVTAPSALAIEEGIRERWKQLSGLLIRVPFTLDQAKSALERVIRKAPPSGSNNEQFRDCCIWEAVVSAATDRVVHLVSADNAFYEGRNKMAGLASALRADLNTTRKDISIHSSLEDFLAATDSGVAAIDEMAIGDAIIKAIMDQARDIAAKPEVVHTGATFELGKAHRPKISGYATPKPSLVAISFEASFDLEGTLVGDEAEVRGEAKMTLKGVCSYDPARKVLSEIEIREWAKNLNWSGGFFGTASPDKTALDRKYGQGRTRILS